MNISRVIAVEENQGSAIVVGPTAVQLYQQSMRLFSGDEVVVNPNSLPRSKLVGSNVNSLIEVSFELGFDVRAKVPQSVNRKDLTNGAGNENISEAELVLFVEVCDSQLPRSIAFKPVQHVVRIPRLEPLGDDAIRKRLATKLLVPRDEDQFSALPSSAEESRSRSAFFGRCSTRMGCQTQFPLSTDAVACRHRTPAGRRTNGMSKTLAFVVRGSAQTPASQTPRTTHAYAPTSVP